MFSIKVTQDLKRDMKRETLKAEIAVTRAIAAAGRGLKDEWRGMIRGSGLGSRLANTVRLKVYPETEPSLRAAALAWTKAPKIMDAFDKGALIRARKGLYLAIPVQRIGMFGARGKRLTPRQWEKRTGRRLKFVARPGRNALLIDDGTRQFESGRLRRGSFGPRGPRGFKNRIVPVFVLVRQAKLPKKLTLDPLAQRAISRVPGLIISGWRED